MIVFYVRRISEDWVAIEGDEFRHCTRALRKKEGDEIHAFDQNGIRYDARIEKIGRNEAEARIVKQYDAQSPKHFIRMCIAPTKAADRLEFFVAKAVEIGVQEIYLIETEHSEKSRYKLDRLKRIAFSAIKQSLNIQPVDIRENVDFEMALEQATDFDHRLICHCDEKEKHLLTKTYAENARICILIGPEGDFSATEIHAAKARGFEEISLGESRLRTETAGIVALALINAGLVVGS